MASVPAPSSEQVDVGSDLGHFSGKSLTVIYPSPPAAFPVEAIAAAMGDFLAASATVTYNTENGYIGGTNAAATAPNDGMTIGVTPIGGALASLASNPNEFDVDFEELAFLGAVGNAPTALVSSKPDIQTFDQVISSAAPFSFVAFPASRQLISSHMIARMFDVPATMLTGYPASAAAAAGLRRGDGNLGVIALDQILDDAGTEVASGYTPLLLMGDVPTLSASYPVSRTIPSLESILERYPPTSDVAKEAYKVNKAFSDSAAPAIAFFMPPATPAPLLIALRSAFTSALRSAAIAQALADVTVSNAVIAPQTITTWLRSSLHEYGPFIREIAAGFRS